MQSNKYKISMYAPQRQGQVVDVLRYLWGDDGETNRHYFRWKYDANPYAPGALGVMALDGDRVVGFRGYFATRYAIDGVTDNIIVLIPGDTVVHPDHRRKGLSVAMGDLASTELAGDYAVMLNATATNLSLPGYLRLGFQPVTKKVFHSCYRLGGFVQYIWNYRARPPAKADRDIRAVSAGIQVAESPRPEAMAEVVAQQRPSGKHLRLHQDQAFFQWRYRNKRKRYRFYYAEEENRTAGFLVVGLSPNRRRGYILDYGARDGTTLEKILKAVIRYRHYDIISVYRHCIHAPLAPVVERMGFKSNSLVRRIENRMNGELPLLVRPVRKTYREADFFIHGLDIRDADNWQLKGVSSDDA